MTFRSITLYLGATVFLSGTDLVVTDIWAGLLLLATREFSVLQDSMYSPGKTAVAAVGGSAASDGPLGGTNNSPPPEWMNLRLADRYGS